MNFILGINRVIWVPVGWIELPFDKKYQYKVSQIYHFSFMNIHKFIFVIWLQLF